MHSAEHQPGLSPPPESDLTPAGVLRAAMSSGEWERLVGLVITPALEEAAAELNDRPGLIAQVSEHPSEEACILWIGRCDPASAFLSPHGSFMIHDEPVLAMLRVDEADPTIADGRPVVRVYLRRSEVSVASVKAMAMAFAARLPPVEHISRANGEMPAIATGLDPAVPERPDPAAASGVLAGQD